LQQIKGYLEHYQTGSVTEKSDVKHWLQAKHQWRSGNEKEYGSYPHGGLHT